MGGAHIQLVAYGVEDMFLTHEPQITFFKMVYRRHTSFTKEQIPQYFTNKQPNFGKSLNCTIARNGDMVGNILLMVTLPNINLSNSSVTKFAWVKRIGFALIKSVSISINGNEIDKHYGDWLNVWAELTGDINGKHGKGYKSMIGENSELNEFSYSKKQYNLFIPLQFWFCRNQGMTLPLISLQYSDVKINVEFQEDNFCYILSPTHSITCIDDITNFNKNEYIEQNIDGDIRAGIFDSYDIITKKLYYYKITENPITSIPITSDFDINNKTSVSQLLSSPYGKKYLINGKTSEYSTYAQLNNFSTQVSTSVNTRIKNLNLINAFLLIDYYFLDDEERQRFSESKHDYIIEQLFYTPEQNIDDIARNLSVTLSNPCKLMIWTTQMKYIYNSQDYYNYTDSYINKKVVKNDVNTIEPIGNNIIKESTILFNGNERITFRNNKYFEYLQQYQTSKNFATTGINIYSYALYPFEIMQQSGTFNTSQIDNIEIKLKTNSKINSNNVALFKCYGLCINIFRIINGLGALMFIK